MDRVDMLNKGKTNQLEYIKDKVQKAMDRGRTTLEVDFIKTKDLYEETRQWLTSNSFQIKTKHSPLSIR